MLYCTRVGLNGRVLELVQSVFEWVQVNGRRTRENLTVECQPLLPLSHNSLKLLYNCFEILSLISILYQTRDVSLSLFPHLVLTLVDLSLHLAQSNLSFMHHWTHPFLPLAHVLPSTTRRSNRLSFPPLTTTRFFTPLSNLSRTLYGPCNPHQLFTHVRLTLFEEPFQVE